MSGARGWPRLSSWPRLGTGTQISLAVVLVVLIALVVILLRIPSAVRPTLISPSPGAPAGPASSAGARPTG